MKQHKGNTKTFDELTVPEQAKSISGQIRSLELAMEHIAGKDPAGTRKRIGQLLRLVVRLNDK